MRYTIRHFDLPLLTFEANMDSADTDLHIIKVYEENRSFLPLNLTVSEDGVERWLRHRTIPKNRAYVDALLSKVGLSLNRPLGIITVCKGLSLNDCNGVQREHNKKLNNGLPILHKVPPKRDYGRYFCIMAEKGGTSHGGLTEKLSPFFHAKKQEVNAYGR